MANPFKFLKRKKSGQGPNGSTGSLAAARWEALSELVNKDGPEAIPALITALDDDDFRVRETASALLSEMGEPAVGPLLAISNDGTPRVREEALLALGKIQSANTARVASLIKALNRDATRAAAVYSLEHIGEEAVEPLIEVLGKEDWILREAAAGILGRIHDPRAIEALSQVLETDESIHVRCKAAEALGEMRDPRAIPSLREALRSEYKTVSGEAKAALRSVQENVRRAEKEARRAGQNDEGVESG